MVTVDYGLDFYLSVCRKTYASNVVPVTGVSKLVARPMIGSSNRTPMGAASYDKLDHYYSCTGKPSARLSPTSTI